MNAPIEINDGTMTRGDYEAAFMQPCPPILTEGVRELATVAGKTFEKLPANLRGPVLAQFERTRDEMIAARVRQYYRHNFTERPFASEILMAEIGEASRAKTLARMEASLKVRGRTRRATSRKRR